MGDGSSCRVCKLRAPPRGVPADGLVDAARELLEEAVVLGTHEAAVEEDPAAGDRVASGEDGQGLGEAESSVEGGEVALALS